ncbi:MAG TPA: tRNA (adenosine(37)-N6)-dimethylallyltransferase MiaA [Stackebrandtia sp.]|jgi:tRNA dimethylallyltransferase|uniref:tRNA (adenosine(37)-N6)-dimethylallyltransferase MiaA n=1 Tax=Stackebrandtia sp. TaxID=2023065 RepID=UPI002D29C0E9|nr:tRNA (adenosine(37)-N6)-dimethylallyltransferase MiaA [Stackebrandtia sp.]HZE41815.1 tRNA (adenosine(37)-N6)-dimethylallyltransferase MiaA [Stackebrandtia sp.]
MGDTGNPPSLPGPVVVVTGPTAAGKSALSLGLARALGGEVINADSMQLYRGMDIGTAKLAPDERAGVVHHLLDIWDVTRTASVAEYQELARARVDELLAAGRTPLLVGGSGLYIQAVVDDMEFPGTDPRLRAELEAELAEVGPAALHARLAAQDPAAAAAILPSNGRRIVRALEVVRLKGSFTATLPERRPKYASVHIGIDRDTAELDRRIAERVDAMWRAGFVDEVRGLLGRGLAEGLTASRALGYRQIAEFLDGQYDEEEARRRTTTGTRRFVRRQRSWFGRDERISWLDAADDSLVDKALALIG